MSSLPQFQAPSASRPSAPAAVGDLVSPVVTENLVRPAALAGAGALGELAQAKIRVGMNLAIIVLALFAYHQNGALGFGRVWATFAICAVSAITLYGWALLLARPSVNPRWRIAQRVTSIILDNVAITWLLYFGGEVLAGAYGIYLWITIGYGARYGLRYLYGNLAASVLGYLIVVQVTPFWRGNPSLTIGLGIALLVVPMYAAFLIKRLHLTALEAQLAYAAKSDFIAKMSHELRTPLHGIIAIADLMGRTEASAQQREMIRIISISSNTLLDLINRILDISKFEDGSFALQREPMDLHAVVNDTLSILSPQVQTRDLVFTCFVDTAIENQLIGSPRQLQEVLINLCGNALKFTDQGYVRLAIFADGPPLGDSVPLRFEIEDTGPGISKAHLEKIFDPFFQADDSTTRKHGGTGLGTAIARELVRLMGGEIQVTSELGVGTRFVVRLCLERQTQAPNVHPIYPLEVLVVGTLTMAQAVEAQIAGYGARAVHLDPSTLQRGPSSLPWPAAIVVDLESIDDTAPALKARLFASGQGGVIPVFAYSRLAEQALAVKRLYSGFLGADAATEAYARVLSLAANLSKDYATESSASSSTHGARILVAEDNATNQTIARLALTEAGFHFTLVDNGEAALEELTNGDYDVAVIDMHMPRMDGIEAARIYNFSNLEEAHRVPIIMMTADNRPEVVADADLAGITRFLVKPLKPSLLVDAINSLLVPRHPRTANDAVLASTSATLAAESAPAVLDHEVITELLSYMDAGDQEVFFAEFIEDARRYRQSLAAVGEAANCNKLRDDMHALCGAARTVGAKRLAAYARRLEFMASAQLSATATQIHADVGALIDDVARELQGLIGRA